MALEQGRQASKLVSRCDRRVCDCKSGCYYVYVDYTTEEQPRAYYVGKGNRSRVRRQYRNRKHAALAERLGFDRVIIDEFVSETDALALEVKLIAELGTHASLGFGANLTRGGEGVCGVSSEVHDRIMLTWTDTKRQAYAERMRARNPMKRPEVVAIQRQTLSRSLKGVKKSETHRENIRLSKMGDKNPMSTLNRRLRERKSKKAV